MLLSSSTSSGMGEHTKYTLSTFRNAAASVSFFAKSAITVSVPGGAFVASAAERYIARCFALLFATSCKTAFPTFPLAPVTKIIEFLLNCPNRWRGCRETLRDAPLVQRNGITLLRPQEVRTFM